MEENNMQVQQAADQQNANPQTNSADQGAQKQASQQNTAPNDDIMRNFQSEIDRRVTQALEKQRKEYEKKLSLTGLNEQQRALAERDQQIEALTEQLRTAQAEHNRYELTRTLAERSLPLEFADLIAVTDDSEEMLRRVNALDTAYKAAVEAGVKERIAGKGAPGRASAASVQITKEQFARMSIAELEQLHRDNPEAYKALSGR